MSVGIKVNSIVDEVGASSFLNSFFSTVVGLLEQGTRGSRFPVISLSFYKGSISTEKVSDALKELVIIKDELSTHAPNKVIWDIEDSSKLPPWGNQISAEITSMANYFVTSTGRDLFELLFEALESALQENASVEIVEI
jgi:Immunity protein 70